MNIIKTRVDIPDSRDLENKLERMQTDSEKLVFDIGAVAKAVIEEHFINNGKEAFCKDLMKSCNAADLNILASGTSSEAIKNLISIIQHNNY